MKEAAAVQATHLGWWCTARGCGQSRVLQEAASPEDGGSEAASHRHTRGASLGAECLAGGGAIPGMSSSLCRRPADPMASLLPGEAAAGQWLL